ncbi:hypothetical protein HBI56_191740 [Parastagonospora nodorum]|uniref:Uncharacterized protein n=2 Tax=Phaeosphaeria nodorum (strain SN15 / ATCC MYA-4574 / FGSC 10173) TaxID=321614 RepID=Q0U0M6_PHANO|nr:hypothetical protein SNOG_14733 [Parastagonospora nodorum SN15]KAH3908171.1 hypothetical protein HBH56_178600 [Parastagonospora nodorum]EAT77925.1 hypothetical protein SNOG_14733 [Parastagonospora nodorum SN15]KAH3931802.1 hypothetical protein HBH54_091220 [Parastagonospora nodorum]KAH3956840.1 hypothetical protein HBH51_234270 [Parastagonospora nodorum]KAH3996063.1 hypothetical protein HBI10_161400 [Parastagonospora nodorum]
MFPYIIPAPGACVSSSSTDLNNALPQLQTPPPPKYKPPHNRIPPTHLPRHNPTPALPHPHQLLTRRLGTRRAKSRARESPRATVEIGRFVGYSLPYYYYNNIAASVIDHASDQFVRDVERVGGEVHVLTPTRYQASEGEAVERGNERAVRQNQKIGEQWGYTWGRVGLKV